MLIKPNLGPLNVLDCDRGRPEGVERLDFSK